MREQRQESEWILSCQRSLKLKWGCTKCSYSHLVVLLDVVTDLTRDDVLSELLYVDDIVL